MLRANTLPAWIYRGAKFDLDFQNQRYWGGSVGITSSTSNAQLIGSLIQGNTAAQAGVAPDGNGLYIDFAANLPRITPGCGLWAEGSYKNVALWCRDFTNAVWIATTMTVAKDQTGANGTANAASSLLATAPLATVLQTTVLASTAVISSVVIKRLVGTGTIEITSDGATWTDVTSQVVTTKYTMVQNAAQTLANPVVGIRLTTSGDKVAVDYFQCENNALGATTPIVTTSAIVTRGAGASDEPAINDPNTTRTNNGLRLINDVMKTGGPWSVLGISTGNSVTNGTTMISDTTVNFRTGTAGGTGSFCGAASANNGTFGLGNINKGCGRIRGGGTNNAAFCLNGGAIATATYTVLTPSDAFTHCGLGNNGAGSVALNGYLLRLAFWDKPLSDGEMIEFTR